MVGCCRFLSAWPAVGQRIERGVRYMFIFMGLEQGGDSCVERRANGWRSELQVIPLQL